MVDKTYLNTALEREKKLCETLETGSEEYVKCMNRILEYEKQLAGYEKDHEDLECKKKQAVVDQKNKKKADAIEWTKIGCNVALPIIGFVAIVAQEKDISFVGALRDVTKCFLPKKM